MNKKLVRTLLRVSSRQQLHGDDIPLQRAETKNFIEQHSAWVFDREYIEKAVSGYKNGIDKCSWKYLKMQESMNLISC